MMLSILSFCAAVLIVLNGVFGVIRRMNRCTPHGMRFAWLAMTTGAFGVLLRPLYGASPPSLWETILLVGIAFYIAFDRRQRACEVPQ